MSASKPTPAGVASNNASLEELALPEEVLTPEQAEQIRGGVAIKGALTDVCRTPPPSGPVPIPYPN